jgi:predicted RNase H-like HicB family nuclease
MTTYAAHYWREGDTWEAELVDEPRVHTFGVTLGRARRYIREATAAWYDEPVDRVEIEDRVDLPGTLAEDVRKTMESRAEAERARAALDEELREAIIDLLDAGLSTSDVGEYVNLSSQRVSQLARDQRGRRNRRKVS